MKQYQNTLYPVKRNFIKPSKIQRLVLVLVLGVTSTAVLAGCTNTPKASTTSEGSSSSTTSSSSASSPTTSSTPASSPTTSSAPATSPTTSSATQSTNVKKAEEALKRLYTEKAGVPIDSVTCPENAELKPGGSFECQATAQNVKFAIQVKMETKEGQFDSKTKGLLLLSKIEDLLQKTVKEKANLDVTADCGGKIRAAKTGDSFTCKVKNKEGQTRDATVTVNDEQGNINVKL